jgi:hypothetical protein
VPLFTRPTIVVGYAASGRRWLSHVSRRLLAIERHRGLHELGLLQFWLVGGDAAQPVEGALDLDHRDERLLRELLERARLDQHRFQVPGVEMHELVVVDRPSLWLTDAEASLDLHGALDKIRLTSSAGAPRNEFELRWWSFIDAATGAVDTDAAQRQRAGAFLRSTLPRRRFLVDRLSSATGVVQPAQADMALAEVAAVALHGALLAPDRTSGEQNLVHFLSEPQDEGAVTPISVGTLRHPVEAFETSAAEALLASLAAGPDDQAREYLRALGNETPDLPTTIAAGPERGSASAYGLGPHLDDRLRGYFARMLEAREPVLATRELEQARAALGRMAVGTANAPAALILAPLVESGFTPVMLGALGVALVAAIAVFALRSRPQDSAGSASTAGEMSTAWTEAQLSEWRRLLDALEQVTTWWIAHCRQVRQESSRMTAWQGMSPSEAYATWVVLPAASGSQAPRAARLTYERMLGRLAGLVRIEGADPGTLWKNEALAMTRGRTDLNEQAFGDRLRDALDAFRRDWPESLRALSLLAPVASANAVGHVLWLTPAPAATRDVLTKLEEGVSGREPVLLRSESTDRTVRLAIGHDVPFTQLSTLSTLK